MSQVSNHSLGTRNGVIKCFYPIKSTIREFVKHTYEPNTNMKITVSFNGVWMNEHQLHIRIVVV